MNNQQNITNWLITALQQPAGRASEFFYFDKRDHEFFSILVADYFLIDEDFQIREGIHANYSDKSIKLLIDRMKRIDDRDRTIIEIPRLQKHENGNDSDYLIQKMDSFLNLNAIDIETATIWDIEEKAEIRIAISGPHTSTNQQ